MYHSIFYLKQKNIPNYQIDSKVYTPSRETGPISICGCSYRKIFINAFYIYIKCELELLNCNKMETNKYYNQV